MTEIHGHDIMVAGQNLEVRWGRNRTKKLDGNEGPEYEAIPGLPGKLPGIEEAAEMAGGSKAAPDLSKGVAIFWGGKHGFLPYREIDPMSSLARYLPPPLASLPH